jgi:hypothetical protein
MPSSCSPSSQPLRGRFAQGECFAFAGLDGSARQWRLAHHVLLVRDRGHRAAIAHQKDMDATCRANEAQSPRRARSKAEKRPLWPLDGGSAAWPFPAQPVNWTAVGRARP